MSNEIQALGVTGKTLYVVIRNNAAQVWNGTTFEAYTASHYATYPIALTEQGATGYYVGTFPTSIATAGLYNIDVRLQAGGSPAVADSATGGFTVQWGGSAEALVGTDPATATNVVAIKAKTDQLSFASGVVVSSASNLPTDYVSSSDITAIQAAIWNASGRTLTSTSASTPQQIATAIWQDLLASADFTQGGSAGQAFAAIAASIAQLAVDSNGNVHALVEGYASGQDPATIFDAAPLSLNPTAGTNGEALAAMRALAKGRKVESLGDNTMKVFAHDNVTLLFTVTYAPSIVAPNATTAA